MSLTNAALLNPAVRIDAAQMVGARANHVIAPVDISGNNVAFTQNGLMPIWFLDDDGVPAFRWRSGALRYATTTTPRTVIVMGYQPKSRPGNFPVVAARAAAGSAYGKSVEMGFGECTAQLESYTDPPATLDGRLPEQQLTTETGPYSEGWIVRTMTLTSPGGNQHQLREYMVKGDVSNRRGAGSYDTRNNWGILTATDQVAIGRSFNSDKSDAGYSLLGVVIRCVLIYDVALTPAQVRQVTEALKEEYRPATLRKKIAISFTTGNETPVVLFSSGDDRFVDASEIAHNSTAGGTARSVRDPSTLFIGGDYLIAASAPRLDPFDQTKAAFPTGTPPTSYYHSIISAIPIAQLAGESPAMTQRSVINWRDATPPAAGLNVTDGWAPELLQDANGDVYCLASLRWRNADNTSSQTFQPYICKALNPGLTAWGTISKLAGDAFPGLTLIDTVIARRNTVTTNRYRCFVKQDDSIPPRVGFVDGPSLLGPFNGSIDWLVGQDFENVEGQNLIWLGGDNWLFAADDYLNVRGGGLLYRYSTDDMATWGPWIRPDQVLPFRHGNLDDLPISVLGDTTAADIDATGRNITVDFSRDLETSLPPQARGMILYARETLPDGRVRDIPYKVARVRKDGPRRLIVTAARRVVSTAALYLAFQNGNISYSDGTALTEFYARPVVQTANTTTLLQSKPSSSALTLLASDAFPGADIAYGDPITNFGSNAQWRRVGNALVAKQAGALLTRTDVTAVNPVVELTFNPTQWVTGTLPGLGIIVEGRFAVTLNTYSNNVNNVSVTAGVYNESVDTGAGASLALGNRLYKLRLSLLERSSATFVLGEIIDTTDGAVVSVALGFDDWGGRPTGAKAIAVVNAGGPNNDSVTNLDNLFIYERTLYASTPTAPTGVVPIEGDGLLVTVTDANSGDLLTPLLAASGFVASEDGAGVSLESGVSVGDKQYWVPKTSGRFGVGASVAGGYSQGSVADNSSPPNLLATGSFAVTNNSGGGSTGTNTVADPVFSPPPGVVAEFGTIFATSPTPSAILRFTTSTDGSEPPDPTDGSPEWTSPLPITPTGRRIKAQAFRPGFIPSAIVSGSWTQGTADLSGGTIALPAGQTGISSLYVRNAQSASGGSGGATTYSWLARVAGVLGALSGQSTVGDAVIVGLTGATGLLRRAARGAETADSNELTISLATGGGSAPGPSTPPDPTDFAVRVVATRISQGNLGRATLIVEPAGTVALGPLTVAVSGLPAGVTIPDGAIQIAANGVTTILLFVAFDATPGTYEATVTVTRPGSPAVVRTAKIAITIVRRNP